MASQAASPRSYAQRWGASVAAAQKAAAQCGADTPIDHHHLARYTLGDRALEIEILDLFLAEAPLTLRRLKAKAAELPCDPKGWVVDCHTLKGSARAVGAFYVAAAAEHAEKEVELTPGRLEGHLIAISAALATVTGYVAEWRQKD